MMKAVTLLNEAIERERKIREWKKEASRDRKLKYKTSGKWGAAIAQWIRLCLPSCRPGLESQAHHLCFFQFIFVI